jgi:hypothetical protein
LGSYRLTGWAKFYQDSEGHYPAWYKDGYPDLPKIGENTWRDWFDKDYMPVSADGKKHGSWFKKKRIPSRCTYTTPSNGTFAPVYRGTKHDRTMTSR